MASILALLKAGVEVPRGLRTRPFKVLKSNASLSDIVGESSIVPFISKGRFIVHTVPRSVGNSSPASPRCAVLYQKIQDGTITKFHRLEQFCCSMSSCTVEYCSQEEGSLLQALEV